jgi:DNA-directed RNA polymerase specialized sigma24 family protein
MYRVALNTAIARLRKEKNNGVKVDFDENLVKQLVDNKDTLLEERSKVLYLQIAKLSDLEKAIFLII